MISLLKGILFAFYQNWLNYPLSCLSYLFISCNLYGLIVYLFLWKISSDVWVEQFLSKISLCKITKVDEYFTISCLEFVEKSFSIDIYTQLIFFVINIFIPYYQEVCTIAIKTSKSIYSRVYYNGKYVDTFSLPAIWNYLV